MHKVVDFKCLDIFNSWNYIFVMTDRKLKKRYNLVRASIQMWTIVTPRVQTGGVTFSIESLSQENCIQVGVVVQSLPHCSLKTDRQTGLVSDTSPEPWTIRGHRFRWLMGWFDVETVAVFGTVDDILLTNRARSRNSMRVLDLFCSIWGQAEPASDVGELK